MVLKAAIGWLRHVAAKNKSSSYDSRAIRSILVVELARLGDVMAMLPALRRLRRAFPHASVTVLVNQHYVSLLSAFDTGCEVVGFANPDSIFGLMKGITQIRKKPADLAMSMSTPRRNAFVALASKSPFKLGYLSYVDTLTPFLETTEVEAFGFVPPSGSRYGNENIYLRSVKILEAARIDAGDDTPRLGLKSDEYRPSMKRLETDGVVPDGPYVLLFPFAGWKYREWGLGQYIALGNRIAAEMNHSVFVLCDEDNRKKVLASLPSGCLIKVLTLANLLDVAALMKGSSLVVANDSGPLHLAAALGCATLGLFGPAPPALTAPLKGRGESLYQRVECSPCDQRGCVRPHNPCMNLHTVDQVFRAAASILSLSVVQESVSPNVQG